MNLRFRLQMTSKNKNPPREKRKQDISKGKAGKRGTRKRVSSQKISLGGDGGKKMSNEDKIGQVRVCLMVRGYFFI